MGQEVSVVVGAAEGMGLAVSERLARMHPGRLVLADVQGEKVAGVAERLRGAGTDCVAVPMDLTGVRDARDTGRRRLPARHVTPVS